jgi:gluconokinase
MLLVHDEHEGGEGSVSEAPGGTGAAPLGAGGVPLSAAEPPLVLALDAGTSSVRALVYDALGRPVQGARASSETPLRTTADGGIEADPDHLVEVTCALLDSLAHAAPQTLAAVRAVGACTFWHSLLGVDAAGCPLTPLLPWADARAHAAAERLRSELDERAVHARTGCMLHWSYWPAKLRWLAATQPAAVARVARWLSFGEYLYLKLFGERYCSLSMASGTGLLDQHTRDWDPGMLMAVPVDPAALGPLGDRPLSGLRPEYAARWPALRAVPWLPAYGDGACSNVGSGCVTRDRFALMVGTSGALRAAWRAAEVRIPWGAWCYRVDAERVVLGGALNDAGSLFGWLLDTLRLEPAGALDAEIAALPADGHGLTILPFLAGERSPGWATHAQGAVLGLTIATRPVDLLRAGMEAVALRFALLAGILDAEVPGSQEIVGTGGGLVRSPAWRQIMADALGRPVMMSGVAEASSRGAALFALETLGAVRSVEEVPAPLGAVYAPDPARHARYQAALARQQQYYDLLVAPRQAAP